MADRNTVVLSGTLAGVSQRSVGTAGRSLHELKVTITKPAARGREAGVMVVPVIVWAPELGLALEGLDVGTPITVIGRISARSCDVGGRGRGEAVRRGRGRARAHRRHAGRTRRTCRVAA